MWIWMIGTALAGPPFQGCDVQEDGSVAFMAPLRGELLVFREGEIAPLTTIPMPENGKNHHVLFGREDGGWWVGTAPVYSVSPEGAVLALDANPSPMFAALGARHPASPHPSGGYIEAMVNPDSDPPTQSIIHVNGDDKQTLIEVNAQDLFATMQGLHATPAGVWAIRNSVVALILPDGKQQTHNKPGEDVYGVCAADDAVYVVSGTTTPCLFKLDGEKWSELGCYKK